MTSPIYLIIYFWINLCSYKKYKLRSVCFLWSQMQPQQDPLPHHWIVSSRSSRMVLYCFFNFLAFLINTGVIIQDTTGSLNTLFGLCAHQKPLIYQNCEWLKHVAVVWEMPTGKTCPAHTDTIQTRFTHLSPSVCKYSLKLKLIVSELLIAHVQPDVFSFWTPLENTNLSDVCMKYRICPIASSTYHCSSFCQNPLRVNHLTLSSSGALCGRLNAAMTQVRFLMKSEMLSKFPTCFCQNQRTALLLKSRFSVSESLYCWIFRGKTAVLAQLNVSEFFFCVCLRSFVFFSM